MSGEHYSNIANNYCPGSNSDPYREYWNGICYIRRWKGINMAGKKVMSECRWTVQEQRQGKCWLVHQKWKEATEEFEKKLKGYN